MAAPPRFESLPPEIRNIVYSYLLPPAYLKKIWEIPTSYLNPPYWAHVLHPANTAIRRTNRNINREASAVLYRDILLISIEWKINSSICLDFNDISHRITFNLVQPGAPLPPCVVHIQQNYHDENSTAARVSTIVAAVDFPAICRLLFERCLNYMDKARTSYLVVSLPKMGYNVDKLSDLIWSPLLKLREGRLRNVGERIHHSVRVIDCTGVFEQTVAELDWNSDLDDGDDTDQDGESDENGSDGYGSETDIGGGDDDDEEEIGKEDTDEEDNDEDISKKAKSNENSNEDAEEH